MIHSDLPVLIEFVSNLSDQLVVAVVAAVVVVEVAVAAVAVVVVD